MGASQSSTASCTYTPVPTDPDENGANVRPHGLGPNARYIPLNSSYCSLYNGIVSLVRDNKYADLLVICGGDRYPVHRAIVCPRSSFFEEQCRPRDGEQDYSSPAKPTKIWIDPSVCESHVLAAALTFLYTLDYSSSGQQALTFGLPEEVTTEDDTHHDQHDEDHFHAEEEPSVASEPDVESMATSPAVARTPSQSSNHSSHTERCHVDPGDTRNELVFHVQMCAAGHQLGIASLCDIAQEKLNKRLHSGNWRQEMVGCIRELYKHGNGGKLSGLRESVVKSARSRFRALKACEGWDDLIIDFPEFAAEMLRRL